MQKPSVRWALAGLSLSMLMPSLDTSIVNAGLPALAAAFDASFQHVQWVVLAYLLAVTTMIVSAGRLGDAIGRRRLLLTGIVGFIVASLLCGMAPTLGLLLAARTAQGLGAAVMMALAVAFVGDTIPKDRVGRAMGLLGTMSAVGTTLGPSLGGLLIASFGWRAIFLLNVPVGVLTLVLAYRHLPIDLADVDDSKAEGVRFDYAGTVLLALTLAAYALAMTLGRGHFGSVNITLLLAAVGGAGLLLRVEARTASPLIAVAMFRDPAIRAGLVLSALVFTVMMTTLVVGPFYLFRSLGLSAVVVGFVLSVGPLVAALTGVPAGRLVDRFGAKRMTIIGLAGITGGASVLSMFPASFGVIAYVVPIGVMTASYAVFQAANNTAIMTVIRPEQRGAVAGMLGLSRNLGLITGASVMGAVFAASSMRFTFGVAAMLILVALAIAVSSQKSRGNSHVRLGVCFNKSGESLPPDNLRSRKVGAAMGISARFPRASAITVALSVLFGGSVQANGSRTAAPDIRVSNFGKINDRYYRGAQPKGRDYADLAALGVKTIVDLRNDAEVSAPSMAKEAGLNYVVIPLSGWERPDDAAVTQFLAAVNDPANQPVYVHCQVGKHRTGAMTAVYRMTQDGWDATQAYTEMKKYHFKNIFTPHTDLKEFVFEYYTQLQSAAAPSKSAGL